MRASGRQLAGPVQVVAGVVVVWIERERAFERPDCRPERALAKVGVAEVEGDVARCEALAIDLLVRRDGSGVVAAEEQGVGHPVVVDLQDLDPPAGPGR